MLSSSRLGTPEHGTSDIDVTTTHPSHWTYISEGGATIVFSYTGPEDERFHRKALRIRKSGVATDDEDGSIAFQTEVISRLVPSTHLVHTETVSLTSSWLEMLSDYASTSRPDWRTASIDTTRSKGILVPDLTSSPISVEIKPKWSFLRSEMRTCRFCMHSHYRSRPTPYCPLDLFSPSPARVMKAVNALYDSWSEGHETWINFKVFVGGDFVTAPDLGAQLYSLGVLDSLPSDEQVREIFVRTLHTYLIGPQPSALLRTLDRLQRTLDGLGIQGLEILWNKVHSTTKDRINGNPSFGEGCAEPSLDEWHSFVTEYLKRNEHDSDSERSELHTQRDNEQELHYQIMSYLLSTTFKDCSIMIMLPGLLSFTSSRSTSDDRFIPITTPEAVSRITLIDLDPKPVRRLKKWLDLDRDISRVYDAQQEDRKKSCVDDGLQS